MRRGACGLLPRPADFEPVARRAMAARKNRKTGLPICSLAKPIGAMKITASWEQRPWN